VTAAGALPPRGGGGLYPPLPYGLLEGHAEEGVHRA
jgi:hypothetical protein